MTTNQQRKIKRMIETLEDPMTIPVFFGGGGDSFTVFIPDTIDEAEEVFQSGRYPFVVLLDLN